MLVEQHGLCATITSTGAGEKQASNTRDRRSPAFLAISTSYLFPAVLWVPIRMPIIPANSLRCQRKRHSVGVEQRRPLYARTGICGESDTSAAQPFSTAPQTFA